VTAIEKGGFGRLAHSHARVWFRGHGGPGWELKPSVYREGFPAKDEEARLKLERQLAQDFRVTAAGLLNGTESEAQLYFLQQHYRIPTRLLDWTTSPLHGLYFAAQSGDDGELYIMDAHGLAEDQKVDSFRGTATERSGILDAALAPIFHGEDADFPDYILAIRPDQVDRRVTLQRACFTFHVPARPVLTSGQNHTLQRYLVPAAAKQALRNELSLLGIDDFAVFGDLESLSRRLKNAYAIK